MDKRSIFFVIILSITFFFINQWFAPDTSHLKKQTENISAQDITLTDVQLEKLYTAPNEASLITYCLNCSNQYLTLAWKNTMPKKIYVKREGNFQEVELLSKFYKKNEPVLFGSDPEKVTFSNMIKAGKAVLVVFNGAQDPQLTLVDIQNEKISSDTVIPSKNGLILLKTKNRYEPVSFYDDATKKIYDLDDYYSYNNDEANATFQNAKETSKEEFYLLENDYVQMVFSTAGGAVAEINLPFKSKNNSLSVVKQIEIDRIIATNSPENDLFPQNSFYQIDPSGQKVKTEKGTVGGFYPLLRRSLYKNGQKIKFPAKHYAFNLVSENSEDADFYKVTRFEKNLIEFTLSSAQKHVVKTFILKDDPYIIELSIKIDGNTKNISMTSGIPEVELIMESYTPELKYLMKKNDKPLLETIDIPKTYLESSSAVYEWVCNSNGFFGLILNGLSAKEQGYKVKHIKGSEIPTRLSIIDPQYDLYPAEKYPGYEILVPFRQLPHNMNFRLFTGPFDGKILKTLDKKYADLGTDPNYVEVKKVSGFLNFISQPFAQLLYFILKFFHYITHSWGIAILLLTVFIRIVLYPINNWSIKSQSKMQMLSPKIKEIQERYKKDPKRAQMEIMKVYRENGGNPLAGGCLPMLIQIPILFGIYLLLKSSFELRGQIFIPYWIDNLAAPDVLFSWSYPLPLIGNQFHFLPFLLSAATFLQQKLFSNLPKDKTKLNDQQRQQILMTNIMTIAFLFIFYKLPSGLNIYYLFSTILGILQQWIITKKSPKPILKK